MRKKSQKRHPSGTPIGGRFATTRRADAQVSLLPTDEQTGAPTPWRRSTNAEVEAARTELCAHELLTKNQDVGHITMHSTAVGVAISGLWDHKGRDLGEGRALMIERNHGRELRQLYGDFDRSGDKTVSLVEAAGARHSIFGRLKLRDDVDLEQLRSRAQL